MASVDIIQLLKSEGGEKFYPVTHKNAVIGLTEFFEAVPDNSGGISVRLRPEYTGLWADGWISAGGISANSGGGGVSDLKGLTDVYHSSSGVLRADGSAVQNGDALVYNTSLSKWVAASVGGGGGGSTVSVTQVISSGTKIATITVDGVGTDLYAPSGGSGGSTVTWGVQSGNKIPLTVDGTMNEVLLSETDPTVPSWAKQSSKPSYTFSEIGSKPTTLSGYGITDAKIESGVITLGSNTITPLTSFTETDPTVPSWAKTQSPAIYALGTLITTSAARGTMLGVSAISYDLSSTGSEQSLIKWEPNAGGTGIGAWHFYGNLYADGWVSAGGVGSGGSGGSSSLKGMSDVYHSSSSVLRADGSAVQNGDSLVYSSSLSKWVAGVVSSGGSTVSVTQVVSSGTKIATITVNGVGTDLYAPSGGSGTVTSVKVGTTSYNPDSSGIVSLPAYPTTLPASDVYSWAKQSTKPSYTFSEIGTTPTTLSGYGITDAKISNGTITLGSNTITPLTSFTETDPTVPSWAKQSSKPSYTFSEIGSKPTTLSGYGITDAKINSGVITLGSNTITPVTLTDTQTISGAKTFSTNPITIGSTSGLSVNSSSYIDIGDARLVYDPSARALHVTMRSGTSETIGLYADGFVSAGGATTDSGLKFVALTGNQTVNGNKTFAGNTSFEGTATFAITGGTTTIQQIINRISALEQWRNGNR